MVCQSENILIELNFRYLFGAYQHYLRSLLMLFVLLHTVMIQDLHGMIDAKVLDHLLR